MVPSKKSLLLFNWTFQDIVWQFNLQLKLDRILNLQKLSNNTWFCVTKRNWDILYLAHVFQTNWLEQDLILMHMLVDLKQKKRSEKLKCRCSTCKNNKYIHYIELSVWICIRIVFKQIGVTHSCWCPSGAMSTWRKIRMQSRYWSTQSHWSVQITGIECMYICIVYIFVWISLNAFHFKCDKSDVQCEIDGVDHATCAIEIFVCSHWLDCEINFWTRF